jgi:hypothetical protein
VQPDETVDAIEFIYAQGWTDGLPVVPPTVEKVRAMVERSGRTADELIAELPPKGGKATVEKIATNAVMAGCLPAYMPVILTALEAMLEPHFNLRGVLYSTHLVTPLLILHGPLVQELGVNCGHNVFGLGWRANATIGQAVQLTLVNIGAAVPGVLDKATFGHPGKYTYCIAENEAASRWEPLHVERGLQRQDSTVTVYPACSTLNFISSLSCGVTSSFIPILLSHRSRRSWQRAATLLSRLLEIEVPVYRAVCTMLSNSKAVVSPLLCCVRKYSWILRRHMLSPMASQRRVVAVQHPLAAIAPQAVAALTQW